MQRLRQDEDELSNQQKSEEPSAANVVPLGGPEPQKRKRGRPRKDRKAPPKETLPASPGKAEFRSTLRE